MSKIPDKVWLLDDDKNRITNFQDILKDRIEAEKETEQMEKKFGQSGIIPDVFMLDICFSSGEAIDVQKPNQSYKSFISLSKVTGVQFLRWLQMEWPGLPVVVITSFWDTAYLPNLFRHAVCSVTRPDTLGHDKVAEILWIAQQAIIGVRLDRIFRDKAIGVLNKINSSQNHFYFIICDEEDDLIAPPENIFSNDLIEANPSLVFEAWNNRIIGFIDDIPLTEEINLKKSFYPILPFSKYSLTKFNVRLGKDIKFMGERYFEPYFTRECARVAYSLFFNIKPHPIGTGKCIFDSSTYPPDLLNGIGRGEICPECLSQMKPRHANGGWSEGRDKAAQTICKMAKESLNNIRE
ncbi:MAG: hypothetical protein ABSC53_08680 [Bacteroidota bacterium]